MHKVIFYPVGNGDASQILLQNGRRLLFDYHHQKKSEELGSTLFNLKRHLRMILRRRIATMSTCSR
jgi:hypothetical protein